MENQIIYFVHIPKAGGMTVQHILHQLYPHDQLLFHHYFDDINEKEMNPETIKVVHGHYLFGLHNHFNRPFSYFTMLREPVDRVISQYYYLRGIEGEPYDKFRQMTLEEFVRHHSEHNIQTAFLSGNVQQPDLHLAKKNLKRHFDVVGLTEYFNESLFLLAKRYGWPAVHYKRTNVTKSRKQVADLPAATIELIKQINDKDMKLYEFARKRFESELQGLTQQENVEMTAYIKAQKAYEMTDGAV